MSGRPYDFDPAKNEANRAKHGVGLDEFMGFDAEPAVLQDRRADHGEDRFRAFGRIEGVGYMLAFTIRDGRMRLISFRRAREKEMRRYE